MPVRVIYLSNMRCCNRTMTLLTIRSLVSALWLSQAANDEALISKSVMLFVLKLPNHRRVEYS
jgi:hypothetical protein